MINDQVKALGEVQLVLRDENGNIKHQATVPNLVVTVGKNVIASRLVGAATPVMSHMGIGTSTTVQTANNTTLITEVGRAVLTPTGGSSTNNIATFTSTFAAGVGTGAITEAGIFNGATGGSMLCRTTFGAFQKDALDSLTISWAIVIS